MKLIHPELKNKPIEAIIFDLGAVIINIDYNKTRDAFQQQGIKNFDVLFSKARQSTLFDRLEKGLIDATQFRHDLRALSGVPLTDEVIDACWNKMLLQLPKQRIQLLNELKQHFPLFLLSNTNIIHEKAFAKYIDAEYGWHHFTSMFKQIYFSHHIHMRKPDLEIFEKVLHDHQLNASTTLFIDDSPQHIEGALKIGINAFHLTDDLDICDLFAR
ncbi:MAG: HAD family hydrolase [Bacteroidota bacterium]|jgi:FMN phosphatase YigB (HAD superfamily)